MSIKLLTKYAVVLALLSGVTIAHAQIRVDEATPKLQAVFLIKILGFNKIFHKNYSDFLHIHVIGEYNVYKQLAIAEGKSFAETPPLKITYSSDGIDVKGVDVVYVGKEVDFDKLRAFVDEKKIITITGKPGLFKRTSVGIGIKGHKNVVFIDLDRSKAEGSDWSSVLLKIATVTNK